MLGGKTLGKGINIFGNEIAKRISIFSKNNIVHSDVALRFFVANNNHIENYANVKSNAFLRTRSERSH